MPAAAREVLQPAGVVTKLRDFAELELELELEEADDEAALRARLAERIGRSPDALPAFELKKRALDARGGRVRFHLTLGPRSEEALGGPPPREVDGRKRVAIVGAGPAGLFCAYELARAGIGSVVIDRGKTVQPRRRDLKGLTQHGRVDPDSNYCFGEGGAGTYSDGKLYTRSHKRGDVRDVLELLHVHGAPADILTNARPHIGSNKLPKVISAMRERLIECGVEFRFETRVTGIERGAQGVRALQLGTETLDAEAVVLATGHSARDVYEWLDGAGVRLIAKGFALGVRIEHPQLLINRLQYGRHADHPKLPNAAYRLAFTEEQRGVFSFCMCPGGFIVPAATELDGLVVNGMSLSRRDSPYANSGLVVAVEPQDLEAAGYRGPLAGVAFQRAIERAAKQAGGGTLRAPATRATDFLAGKASRDTPETSYQPGLFATDVRPVLDAGGVVLSDRLARALTLFGKRMPGYAGGDAVLVGVESRTSSPVRVPRDPQTLQSPDLPGLYPTAEGAGYAGGIVSAALDGVRVARAIALTLAR
jgi:uncharacterized FAD-dependent dehydrogenase